MNRLSTTVVMSIAAVCAALIAIFGDKTSFSWVTVAFAFVGLVPWALESGGVAVPPPAFYAVSMASAAGIVLVDRNPGGMFPAMIAVVWLTRSARTGAMTAAPALTAAALAVGIALLEGTTHETGAIYFTGGAGVAFLAGSDDPSPGAARRRAPRGPRARDRTRREPTNGPASPARSTTSSPTRSPSRCSTSPARDVRCATIPSRLPRRSSEPRSSGARASTRSARWWVCCAPRTPSATPASTSATVHEGHAHAAPLPQLTDIPALVDQFRDAGMRVSADLRLDDIAADGTTSLTAFRVVQEALSNVLQHSPGSPVELRVAADGEGTVLRITAENPTTDPTPTVADRPDRPARRSGLGLRGMRERVRAAGGSVEAGFTDRQTWLIDAALPLRRGRFS